MWLLNASLCHGIASKPRLVSTLFTSPWLSPNMLLKIRATATGAITNGTSTPMRQNVLARMLRSSIAAMNTAATSWGTLESRKMLNVLRRAVQNCGWPRIQAYWSKPMNSPELRTRSQSMNEMTAVNAIGKSPTTANMRKNGEM